MNISQLDKLFIMSFPREFYYHLSQAKTSYTHTPTGDLDVNQLIQSKAPWIFPASTGMKPKKLILSDWTAKSWTYKKIKDTQEALLQLLNEGFSLYIQQNEQIVPLLKEDLNNLEREDIRTAMRLKQPDELCKTATKQHHLSQDELFILDDYWVQRLIDKDASAERTLKQSDYYALNKDERKLLKAVLVKANPPLDHLLVDKLSSLMPHHGSKFESSFPSTPIQERLQQARVTEKLSSEQQSRLIKSLPALRELSLDSEYLPSALVAERLVQLEKLTLQSAQYATNLIQAMLNLKELSIIKAEEKTSIITTSAQLGSIKFTESTLSKQQLDQILNEQSQSLTNLSLINCAIDTERSSSSIELPICPRLEHIDVSETLITPDDLNQLISRAPNLKSLTLGGHVDVDFNAINTAALNQLEHFCLRPILNYEQRIPVLFTELKNIKCLHLKDLTISTNLISTLNSMPQLNELILTKCDFDFKEKLREFLQKFPNIKKLRLININVANSISIDWITDSFEYLDVLQFEDEIGTIRSPKSLNINNLTELHLINCVNVASGISKTLQNNNSNLNVYWRWDDIVNEHNNEDETNIIDDDAYTTEQEKVDGPKHEAGMQINYRPEPNDFQFKYKGKNKSSDQKMIIEKLAQYLTINQKHLSYIPKINNGICYPLSQFFKNQTIDDWEQFIQRIRDWDGNEITLNHNLTNDFKSLIKLFKQYPLSNKKEYPTYFIGDNFDSVFSPVPEYKKPSLSDTNDLMSLTNVPISFTDEGKNDWISFLSLTSVPGALKDDEPSEINSSSSSYAQRNDSLKLKLQQGCIISNPWHAVSVRLLEDGSWQVYDPNHKKGYQVISQDSLKDFLHHILGTLISIEVKNEDITPRVNNPDEYIARGGLFSLIFNANSDEIAKDIPVDHQFSEEALDGLLLRDVTGKPAWIRGISAYHTTSCTCKLLAQYQALLGDDFASVLMESIELLSPQEKREYLNQFNEFITHIRSVELFGGPAQTSSSSSSSTLADDDFSLLPELIDSLTDVFTNTPDVHYFHQELKTWSKAPKDVFDTPEEYCQHIIQNGAHKKQLIEVNSTESVQALRLSLQKQCNASDWPVYYIHSPEDLVCSASYIKRDSNNHGLLHKGPGGPLHEFLTANHGLQSPTLIVNYEQFSTEDIVKFNALLDEKRVADGTPVSADTMLIGLINTNKPNCYQGDDFYSRFDKVEQCSLSAKKLTKSLSPMPLVSEAYDATVINLFHARDWKERLLGHWDLVGKNLVFQEGALANLHGTTINIQNGPWNNEEFKSFWMEACQPETTYFPGSTIPVPKNIQLISTDEYPVSDLKQCLEVVYLSDDNPDETDKPEVLNPYRLSNYFHNYHYEESDHSLTKQDGLIEKAKNSSLAVHLTHAISLDDWARLLTECQKYQVTLRVHPAPGVNLPDEFEIPNLQPELAQSDWQTRAPNNNTEVIKTTDIDATITILKGDNLDWQVIDVSELSASDLLERLSGALNEELLQFEFQQRPSPLMTALAQGKKVMLKGHFSKELEDMLAPLLLSRLSTETTSGTVLLITEDTDAFNYLPSTLHQVSVEEKRTCLGDVPAALEPFIATEPLCRLKARATFMQAFPEQDHSDAAWAGMSCQSATIKKLVPLNPFTSKQEAEDFTQARRASVKRILDIAPYILLTGPSGAGKTTFVSDELVQEGEALYRGVEELSAWAQDSCSGRKYLFLDEATLSSGNWTLFEGLYNTPPSIFYNGQSYPLDEKHKVIFAGNHVGYGDERRLASFFKRHGNALEFEPLPTAVVYEKILKTAFDQNSFDENEIAELSALFLEVYRFLVDCSTTDVLITPRELEMMALLTNSYCQKHPSVNRGDVAQHVAFKLALNLVPRARKNQFIQQFKPVNSLPVHERPEWPDFCLTDSRMPSQQLLEDLLDLREWRQDYARNNTQRYGGLGAVTFEGEPGIGKSEQIIQTLLGRGFRQMFMHLVPAPEDKPMYLMPVSMSFANKEALLIKAFHEGAVVVIDEINSSPMMEKLLNSLLMGKTPQGELPRKPGFMVIGTQNPITLAGRRAPSNALSRRMITEKLSVYPEAELLTILKKKEMSTLEAKAMIEAFQENRTIAEQEKRTPGPTCRDLLRLAKKYKCMKQGSNKRELLDVENNLDNSQSDNKRQRNVEGNKNLVTSLGLFRQSKRLTRDHEYQFESRTDILRSRN